DGHTSHADAAPGGRRQERSQNIAPVVAQTYCMPLLCPLLHHVTCCCINRFQLAPRNDMPFCGGETMTPAWAQRQAELLSDCIVSPDVFHHLVDRLSDFVVPYQYALETETGQRNVHRYLAGLLSHLDRKNAEQ